VRPAVYSGSTPTVPAAGKTKAEWVTKLNTITFYYQSFSADPNSPDNRFFEANTTYRVFIPKSGSATQLMDVKNRALQYCRRQLGVPIEGDDLANPNCKVDDTAHVITWTFTTGNDTDGPAIDVLSTVPSSK